MRWTPAPCLSEDTRGEVARELQMLESTQRTPERVPVQSEPVITEVVPDRESDLVAAEVRGDDAISVVAALFRAHTAISARQSPKTAECAACSVQRGRQSWQHSLNWRLVSQLPTHWVSELTSGANWP